MQTRIPLSIFVLMFAAYAVFAQTPDADAAKLKEQRRAALLAKIHADAEQLKLPDNRSIISARLGVIAWKNDPDRAKKLFQAAVSELNSAQEEAEAAKGKANLYQDLINSQSIRPQILNTIASADPEYALESLYKTRPTAVARALAGESNERINDQAANRNTCSDVAIRPRPGRGRHCGVRGDLCRLRPDDADPRRGRACRCQPRRPSWPGLRQDPY